MTMEEGHHEFDPVWLSPVRAIKLVEHIRELSADYPDKKDFEERRLPISKN